MQAVARICEIRPAGLFPNFGFPELSSFPDFAYLLPYSPHISVIFTKLCESARELGLQKDKLLSKCNHNRVSLYHIFNLLSNRPCRQILKICYVGAKLPYS
ncbi:hypothetical protein ES703_102972 [subsurface metagenome]